MCVPAAALGYRADGGKYTYGLNNAHGASARVRAGCWQPRLRCLIWKTGRPKPLASRRAVSALLLPSYLGLSAVRVPWWSC